MDLLRYADTEIVVCFAGKNRREINDILRQLLVYRERIRICPCGLKEAGPWVRKTLEFLNAQINNEPSH